MRAAVERAVARIAIDLAARIARVPGVHAEAERDAVIVRGRRMLARWIDDARLRWIGR